MLSSENISNVEFKPNPKKDFLFTWSLSSFDVSQNPYLRKLDSVDPKYAKQFKDVFGKVDYDYISQLAQKVNIPTEELDGATDTYGEVDVYIPVREKFNNIQVTYLDDELETVYKFHSYWLSVIRRHYHPIYVYALSATYHTYSFGFTTDGIPKEATHHRNPKVTQTKMNHYKYIVPMSVQRTSADKGGSNVAGVTVEYRQLIVPSYGNLESKINNSTLTS